MPKKSKLSVEVLALPDDAHKWQLVTAFLQLRKQVFIEKKSWRLSEAETYEWEQYDIVGLSHYIIAHRDGVVVGGARLMRTDTEFGSGPEPYSYMIRDAYRQIIDIPAEICASEPPTSADTWELTRMISTDRSPITHMALMAGTADFIRQQNSKFCIFLGPPAFIRMATRLGYTLERLGPVSGDETGRYLVMKFNIDDFKWS